MAKTDHMSVHDLDRKLHELLSEYGVDRAGVEAVLDLAIEYGESEYNLGYDHAQDVA